MRGHITERRPGVFRIVVSNGFDDAGKRRQVVRTVKGSRLLAERELTRVLKDLDDRKLAGGRQRLGVYLADEWLPGVSAMSKRGRPLAPTTRQKYGDTVRRIESVVGNVRLMDLEARHVEKLREALLADGLAPQTVSDTLRTLSQALGRAKAKGYVSENWAASSLVTRPEGPRPRFVVIDRDLATRILETVAGTDPWDVAAHLGLGLGLRREEVLALRWSDVEGDVVHVRRALTATREGLHVGPPKSEAGERSVHVLEVVARSLRRHRKAQGERLMALGIAPDLVVDNGIGQPWHPASFSTGWRRFADAHGLEGITFHTLRHGQASLLLAAGVADKVALEIMGHADTAILRHYQEVADELKWDAAARLDALLGGRNGHA